MARTAKPTADTRALPRLRRDVTDAVLDHLTTHWPSKRPPEVMARILSLAIELDIQHRAFPTRKRAAEHVYASVHGIDAALSVALDRGLISMDVATEHGNVVQRDGIVRHRFYRPSRELRDLAASASRRSA